MIKGIALAVVACSLLPPAIHAQYLRNGTAVIEIHPARPRAGSLFSIVVRGSPAALAGRVGDEPLHFRWLGDEAREGIPTALAASAVDAKGTIRVEVWNVKDSTDRREIDVPIAPGNYPTERLTVAPTFGTKPDSATQARIDAEGKRSAEVSKASHETPRLWNGAFVTPRPGRVTSGFGRARVFNGEVASRHMGTDFAGAVGAPVRAANRGVVRIVDRFFLGGNVIYIDHGAGLVTAYLHLSKQDVAVGDTVEKGQVIGKVGATGRVTGPHLHLIARYGGVTVDPMSLLAVMEGER